MKKERVLCFSYPFEMKDKMEKLKEILYKNNVEYICYESSGYWNHEFVVRKSGKKWNDIYSIINSVKAAPYKFKSTNIEERNGKLVEVCYC